MPALNANQTLTINGSNFQNIPTLTFVPPEGGTIASTAAKLTFGFEQSKLPNSSTMPVMPALGR